MKTKKFYDLEIGSIFYGLKRYGEYGKFIKTKELCYDCGTTNAVGFDGIHYHLPDDGEVLIDK